MTGGSETEGLVLPCQASEGAGIGLVLGLHWSITVGVAQGDRVRAR